jgi:hypothetical protein
MITKRQQQILDDLAGGAFDTKLGTLVGDNVSNWLVPYGAGGRYYTLLNGLRLTRLAIDNGWTVSVPRSTSSLTYQKDGCRIAFYYFSGYDAYSFDVKAVNRATLSLWGRRNEKLVYARGHFFEDMKLVMSFIRNHEKHAEPKHAGCSLWRRFSYDY